MNTESKLKIKVTLSPTRTPAAFEALSKVPDSRDRTDLLCALLETGALVRQGGLPIAANQTATSAPRVEVRASWPTTPTTNTSVPANDDELTDAEHDRLLAADIAQLDFK